MKKRKIHQKDGRGAIKVIGTIIGLGMLISGIIWGINSCNHRVPEIPTEVPEIVAEAPEIEAEAQKEEKTNTMYKVEFSEVIQGEFDMIELLAHTNPTTLKGVSAGDDVFETYDDLTRVEAIDFIKLADMTTSADFDMKIEDALQRYETLSSIVQDAAEDIESKMQGDKKDSLILKDNWWTTNTILDYISRNKEYTEVLSELVKKYPDGVLKDTDDNSNDGIRKFRFDYNDGETIYFMTKEVAEEFIKKISEKYATQSKSVDQKYWYHGSITSSEVSIPESDFEDLVANMGDIDIEQGLKGTFVDSYLDRATESNKTEQTWNSEYGR